MKNIVATSIYCTFSADSYEDGTVLRVDAHVNTMFYMLC